MANRLNLFLYVSEAVIDDMKANKANIEVESYVFSDLSLHELIKHLHYYSRIYRILE